MTADKQSYFWIAAILALYLLFSLTYLKLSGLQYDEVNCVNAAMGNENAPFIVGSVKIFGKKWPLMIMNYIWAVKSGLYAPIFDHFK
jgi:hypothetical protein